MHTIVLIAFWDEFSKGGRNILELKSQIMLVSAINEVEEEEEVIHLTKPVTVRDGLKYEIVAQYTNEIRLPCSSKKQGSSGWYNTL